MQEDKWNDIRNEAAINALNAILSSSLTTFVLEFIFKKEVAKVAVKYADELVEELRRKEEKERQG